MTNVSSASENGSINLITGKLAFKFPPVTGDDSKRQYSLNLGEMFRNSYNEKTIQKTPLNRSGQPTDIANVAWGLVQSKFITGENIVVDGGLIL